MVLLNLHLSAKYRLSVNISRKRKSLDVTPLLPNLGKVLRAKDTNRFSRYFRLVFENDRIKKLIGTNLAFLVIASSLLPGEVGSMETLEVNSISTPVVIRTEAGIQFPVKNIKITQGYRFYHPGLDLDGYTGDTINPIMSGRVIKVEYSRFGYGKSIVVSHGDDTESLYAHLSKVDVVSGQEVTKDTKIGEMGATGRAFGDHLHLEVYEDGKPINPLILLPE